MRSLPSATMVSRILIGLDRARVSGALRVDGEGRQATFWLESGEVVAANVDRRVATSQRHVVEHVLQVCRWEDLRLRLALGSNHVTWWRLAQPLAARLPALDTMRVAVDLADATEVQAELAGGVYQLTEAGGLLLQGVGLHPEEEAVLPWLRGGVRAEEIPRLPGCGPEACRFVWLLKLVGAVARKAGGSSYPLLLRKRRELRRHVTAHALLDLPEGANRREARLALRKLVGELHPDRFGEGAPPELRRVSGEIVTALVQAESTIAMRAVK
ncbi:MAG: hypothetical protein PVH21_02270 [Myxococcales bacterium]|jgi:hypothetical protein